MGLIDSKILQDRARAEAAVTDAENLSSEITGVVSETTKVVVHKDDEFKSRPEQYQQVIWMGSVEPKNAIDYDQWIVTEPET